MLNDINVYNNVNTFRSLYSELNLGYPSSTFIKDYSRNQSSVDADYSVGSPTGTWTVTRSATTPATYVDANGVIQLKTDITPRFTSGFYNSTGFVSRPGLIVEGAGTNMLLDTSFLDNLATPQWSVTVGSGGTAAISIDSTYTAPQGNVLKFVGSAVGDILVTPSSNRPIVTAGATYTISMHLRGSGKVKIRFKNTSDLEILGSEITLTDTGWKRYSATFTNGTGDPARVICGLKVDSAQSVVAYVANVQLEASPFATSFIPTTTAALTRNAETLTYPISGNRTEAKESLFVKFTPFYADTQNTVDSHLLNTSGGANKEVRLSLNQSTDIFAFYPNVTDSSGTLASTTDINTAFQSYLIAAIAYGATAGTNAELYLDGVSKSTSTSNYTEPTFTGTDAFNVGSRGSSSQINGIISSIAIFSDAKGATDVAGITTVMT